jgi:cytoskeletal protein CcmA (bactofilin family)
MFEFLKQHLVRCQHLSAIVIALLSACVIVALFSFAAAASEETSRLNTLSGDHQKQQFAAAKRVEVTKANVADDIFTAGQYVHFESVSAKSIIAAGMSLSFQGISAKDLILAGGQIDLSGNVTDDVIAAACPFCPFGGQLHVTSTMQIGDDARLAGRDITVDGRIGGDLFAAAQQFRLSGEIVGNARIEAERIVLTPGARIGGDLLYASRTEPEILDGAVVTGKLRQVETQSPFAKEMPKNWIWYFVLAVLGALLALVLLGAALQLAMPGLLSNAAATAVDRPWVSLGRGLALALLLPGAVALLMATVIGVPIGLVTMASYFVLLTLALVAISYCIGLFVRGFSSHKGIPIGLGSRILWTATGILILVIVGLVPFVGWAIGMIAMIAGLGAVVSQLGPVFRRIDTLPPAT